MWHQCSVASLRGSFLNGVKSRPPLLLCPSVVLLQPKAGDLLLVSDAPRGSAVAFGRCLFMSMLAGTSSPSTAPLFLISTLPCQCISEALCVLPLLVILPSSNLNLRLLLSPPPPHPHFIFFSFSLLEPQNMSLFPSFLLFLFLSAQYPVSVWPHHWTFLLFLSFPARCHHLIISGLFDYILCPWLWRGCHEGAFGLILNLLLSLSHTHTRANTHK